MQDLKRKIICICLALVIVIVPAVIILYYELSVELNAELFTKARSQGRGTVFLDRYGRELRFMPDAKGERARWVPLAEIPNAVRDAFIAAEDERFHHHYGFDAIAIMRATWSNITKRRIVSGASTISQQVVRLVYAEASSNAGMEKNGRKRTYQDKIVEIVRSVKLERLLSKDEILEHYLNRVPMGNNLIGVETAAQAYFGVPIKNLSVSEAALLASLPKAPGLLNPYGNGFERLMERQQWVISRMRALGMLSKESSEAAKTETIRLRKLAFQASAPHVVDMFLKQGAANGITTTSIDLDLQQRVQEILLSHADRLKYRGAGQAAAIVIHNPSLEVLSAAGSIEYSERNSGYNNGVLALRSAGSALKPFLYALALESGDGAGMLLQDTERKYRSREGQYSPLNFDRKEYGPVTMRAALGNSLNLSAVKMLERVGEARFYELLTRLNLINHADRGPEHYGLGMAIGNPEVSPEQLAAAFAMLANNGVYRPATYLPGRADAEKRYVLLPQTAYIITDILSDPTARALTFTRSRLMTEFPFKVAIKTGTSTFFRDLWAAGYTSDYTVVVWVGNFDGSPTKNLSGSSAAVPIFADIMMYLYRQSDPVPFRKPKGIRKAMVCGYSGMKPSPYCSHRIDEVFIAGSEPREICSFHKGNVKRHELSPAYAGWLYDRNRTGSAGRFRLSGFGDDLNSVFYDPWEGAGLEREPGIRARNIQAAKSRLSSSEESVQAQAAGHFKIGTTGPAASGIASAPSDAEIKIIYPLEGDRFVLSRHERNQAIKLQAVVARSVPYVDWFMNGKLFKRTGPPYQAVWQMEEGKYRITAVMPSNIGDSVLVTVE